MTDLEPAKAIQFAIKVELFAFVHLSCHLLTRKLYIIVRLRSLIIDWI